MDNTYVNTSISTYVTHTQTLRIKCTDPNNPGSELLYTKVLHVNEGDSQRFTIYSRESSTDEWVMLASAP